VPYLSIITLTPAAGALVIFFLRRHPFALRVVAATSASVALSLSIYVFLKYDKASGGFQFVERFPLVPSIGLSYYMGVDGMNLSLILLTAFILFTGVFASWTIKERSQEFYMLFLILVTGVFGVFSSLDLFLFFFFYELAVLPMYLLIGIWGTGKEIRPRVPKSGVLRVLFDPIAEAMEGVGLGSKEYGAAKLTLYLLLGSAFILVGFLALYFASGKGSFSYTDLRSVRFEPWFQRICFLALYLGFGVLAGVWPLHTWSPDGHAAAPTSVSMLHAGVLMKLGAYGIVRMGFGLFPEAVPYWAPLIGTIASINIVYGALSAMAQTDLKYIVAYSSVSHMGYVMLGAATMNEQGLTGSIFQMFSHGIMTGLLFALVGLVYEKTHTREITVMGGLGRRMTGIAACFGIGGLTSLGLPGLSGFVAELLVFWGAVVAGRIPWFLMAITGTFITAVYVLRVLKIVFFGEMDEGRYGDIPDARGPEWVAITVLSGVLILFGLLPMILVAPIDKAAQEIVAILGGAI
jgi:NADH-quinone oxidoreductase subunit M